MKKRTAWLLTALAEAALIAFLCAYFFFRYAGEKDRPAQGVLVLEQAEERLAALEEPCIYRQTKM